MIASKDRIAVRDKGRIKEMTEDKIIISVHRPGLKEKLFFARLLFVGRIDSIVETGKLFPDWRSYP